ncbi:MAG: ferritin-like domain-containing protein [Planctomycetota bacterium]|jgi:rubrerythrin
MERCINSYKEIIEFAIGREMKAYQLYVDLSKRMVSSKTRELCKKLAKEERKHIKRLEKESARRCQLISSINFSKYDVADGNVNIFANRLSMLSLAVKKEEISANLYRDLAELTKNENARQLFISLAQEELKHKQQVGLEYNNCLK